MILQRGTVLSTNYKKGTVKVKFNGAGDIVDGLFVLCGFAKSSRLPDKKSEVLVLMDGADGYVLGEFYNGAGAKPAAGTSKTKWSIDSKKKSLRLDAKDIEIHADKVVLKTNKGDQTL